MKSLYIPLIVLTSALYGCTDQTSDRDIPEFSGPVIELPVTAEVAIPEKGVAYAFVPNDAAQWLSQIIILSEDGDLYQATADTRMAKPIESPKLVSILGINRPKAPGLFLGVEADTGRLLTFTEVSDEGDFKQTGTIDSAVKIKAFCSHSDTPTNTFHAIVDDGATQRFSLEVTESNIAVTPGDKSKALTLKQSCSVGPNGSLSVSGGTKRDISAGTMATLKDKGDMIELFTKKEASGLGIKSSQYPALSTKVTITDGITIPGVDTPQSVYSVAENFGGPFNNGLILVSDADAPRFVLISADFARETLN